MTNTQISAIKSLEDAFLKCKKAGVKFCGMDDDIYFATKKAIEGSTERGLDDYCPTAVAVQNSEYECETGKVNTHGAYDDSGGW